MFKTFKGKVRPAPRYSKCPNCNRPFEEYDFPPYIFCPFCADENGNVMTPYRFMIDLYYQGKRYYICSDRQGLPLDTAERAYKLLTQINLEIENHTFDISKFRKADLIEFWIANLVEKFYNYKIQYIAPSYKIDYKRYSNMVKDFFKNLDVRDIRKKHIVDFKDFLIQKGLAPKTVKNILDFLKTFLRYCMNELEIINSIPSFPVIEVPEFKFKWLSAEDQVKAYNLIPDHDKPIFAFLMLHGCRPSEARALKCGDVDLSNKVITISRTFSRRELREKRKGKYAKSVIIPIHPEMMPFIAERVKNNLPSAFLFVNKRGLHYTENELRRIWHKVRSQLGLDGVRLYDATRHSVATQLVNSGVSLIKISKLLGHSNIKMTERYAHVDVESLRVDIKKLSLSKKVEKVDRFNKKS